jgi:hypothetical protein
LPPDRPAVITAQPALGKPGKPERNEMSRDETPVSFDEIRALLRELPGPD